MHLLIFCLLAVLRCQGHPSLLRNVVDWPLWLRWVNHEFIVWGSQTQLDWVKRWHHWSGQWYFPIGCCTFKMIWLSHYLSPEPLLPVQESHYALCASMQVSLSDRQLTDINGHELASTFSLWENAQLLSLCVVCIWWFYYKTLTARPLESSSLEMAWKCLLVSV